LIGDSSLVTIGWHNAKGVAIFPIKTDSPLIIDSDAVLAFPIAMQPFQAIARNCR